jgi:Mg-chelatase subunit ChlD
VSDIAQQLSLVAGWLRGHPAVLTGPSVRAVIAAAQLHMAHEELTGGCDLERSALLALPHRLRVRSGVDARQLVRDAVRAALQDGAAEPPAARPLDEAGPEGMAPATRRPVFTLLPGTGEASAPRPGQPALGQACAILQDVLRPQRRFCAADGAADALGVCSSTSDRQPPERHRPGNRSGRLSVRATVRAALRTGHPPCAEVRVQRRRPTTDLDVLLALDVSGSMVGAVTSGLVSALALELVRAGHRVAVVVFADTVTEVCALTRDAHTVLSAAAEFQPAHPTNLELVLDRGRELLLRGGSPARGRHIVVVTDAEPTVYGSGDMESVTALRGGVPPRGLGAAAARHAALRAAARCARSGVAVSLLCPPPAAAQADLPYAARLAAVGGGHARCYAVQGAEPAATRA